MRKSVCTVLCWLLAVSMVWLPFSVTANSSLFSKTPEHCHEMTSAMSSQTVNAQSTDESMLQKDDCRHCGDSCDCTSMSTCSNSSYHTSAFIKIDIHFLGFIQPAQSISEYHAQYLSQIITPDIRPPII